MQGLAIILASRSEEDRITTLRDVCIHVLAVLEYCMFSSFWVLTCILVLYIPMHMIYNEVICNKFSLENLLRIYHVNVNIVSLCSKYTYSS